MFDEDVTVERQTSYLSVELDSQYGVGIGVVADLSSLLEVTDFELSGGLQADDGHQAAGEQTLHNTHILCVRYTHTHARTNNHLEPLILFEVPLCNPCGSHFCTFKGVRQRK